MKHLIRRIGTVDQNQSDEQKFNDFKVLTSGECKADINKCEAKSACKSHSYPAAKLHLKNDFVRNPILSGAIT